MKRALKIFLIVAVVLLVIFGIMAWRHSVKYISRSEAVEIALEDAQLSRSEIKDLDAEFELSRYDAWYEVDFETHGMDYEYSIDAENGDILYKNSKIDR